MLTIIEVKTEINPLLPFPATSSNFDTYPPAPTNSPQIGYTKSNPLNICHHLSDIFFVLGKIYATTANGEITVSTIIAASRAESRINKKNTAMIIPSADTSIDNKIAGLVKIADALATTAPSTPTPVSPVIAAVWIVPDAPPPPSTVISPGNVN